MFKYVEYTKVDAEHTVLEFRGGSEDVVVTNFTGENMFSSVVSISSDDEAKIDALIASQPDEINCTVLVQDEFKALVKHSDQLNNIRRIVKSEIAKKYDIADEIALNKLADDNTKRVDYESYVTSCVAIGDELKSEIGY